MFYIPLAISLLFLTFISCYLPERSPGSRIFSTFIMFLLLLIYIFRGDVGTDYSTYLDIWNGMKNGDSYSYLENGFRGSILLSIWGGLTAEQFYAIFGSCTILISIAACYRLSVKVSVFLLLYFMAIYLTYLFNGMRQAFAMSMLLIALIPIMDSKHFKVIIYSVIASLFHSTGILIYVSYIWSKLRLRIINYIVMISIVIGFLGGMKLFSNKFLSMYSATKADVYLLNFSESTSITQLLYRVVFCIFLYYLFFLKKSDEILKYILKIYLLGISLYFLFLEMNMFATRIFMFYQILFPIFIARYAYIEPSVTKRFLIVLLSVLIIIPSFYTQISNPDNLYKFVS
ncbi:EpsG family protein [Photobacterium leiognathi subsp. mandapamensis]|uniref:EpsG family protein n=1 Tax=Photobacterium leiognathi TaxID=553611 RepID=UPI003AF402CD